MTQPPPTAIEETADGSTVVYLKPYLVEERSNENDESELHLWCHQRIDNDTTRPTALLRVTGMFPFSFIELPMFINSQFYQWSEASAKAIGAAISARYPKRVLGYEFKLNERLYYNSDRRKYPMLVLYFKDTKTHDFVCDRVHGYFQVNEDVKLYLKVHHSSIPTHRKYMSYLKLGYTQWFTARVKTLDPVHRITKDRPRLCEFVCDKKHVTPLDPVDYPETLSWRIKVRIMGYDIEAYSPNPMAYANPFFPNNSCFSVSCVTDDIGSAVRNILATRRKKGIILGNIPEERDDNTVVVNCHIEPEVFIEFQREIDEQDPDILLGYNFYGYDNGFLDSRISYFHMRWENISKLQHFEVTKKMITWKSDAFGYNENIWLNCPGRIFIDVYTQVKRTKKYPRYTLDYVGKEVVKRGKHDMPYKVMFAIFREWLEVKDLVEYEAAREMLVRHPELDQYRYVELDPEDIKDYIPEGLYDRFCKAVDELKRVFDYNVEDSALTNDIFIALDMFNGLSGMAGVGVNMDDLLLHGQQFRIISLLYDECYKRGIVIDQRQFPRQYIQGALVRKPQPGYYKAAICGDVMAMYPHIIKLLNICYTTIVPKDKMDQIPDEECHVFEFDQEEPTTLKSDDDDDMLVSTSKKQVKKTVHYKFKWRKQPIGLLPAMVDKLLRDRITITKGSKHFRIKEWDDLQSRMNEIKSRLEDMDARLSSEEMEAIREEMTQIKHRMDVIERGSMPVAKDDLKKKKELLAAAREEFKELAKAKGWDLSGKPCLVDMEYVKIKSAIAKLEEDIFNLANIISVLDSQQNGLKMTMNSIFGFLLVQDGGKLPLIEGGMCITGKGRELIGKVNDRVEVRWEGTVVYNDTDSSIFSVPGLTPENAWELGRKIIQDLNDNLPRPIWLELEKIIKIFMVTKKRYAFTYIGKDGKSDLSSTKCLQIKGLPPARRDNCPWVCDVLLELYLMVFQEKTIVEALYYLYNKMKELITGMVPADQLILIRAVNSSYSSDSYYMKVLVDNLAKQEISIQPGDRVEFLVGQPKSSTDRLGDRLILYDIYKENPQDYKIDYWYYWEKALGKNGNTVFTSGFADDLITLQGFGYKPISSNKKIRALDKPIDMYREMCMDGRDPMSLLETISNAYPILKQKREAGLPT